MSERKVKLVLGKRGTGKSYHVKKILESENRYLVYDVLGEYSDGVIFQDISELVIFWKNHLDNFRLIYQPLQPIDEFNDICELVWSCGDMLFVVEEIDTFCSSSFISKEFAQIIQRGRHKNISLLGVSQRPFGISRLLTSQAKEIISFQQSEPRDIEYLSAYFGNDVEKIRELPKWSYLKWYDGIITVEK